MPQNRIVLTPWNWSESATLLSQKLSDIWPNVLQRRPVNSNYRYREGDFLVNWGKAQPFLPPQIPIINTCAAVQFASNKIKALGILHDFDVPTVDYTTDIDTAVDWFEDGDIIVVRHKINGHGGDGIEIIDPADGPEGDVPWAPLYTKYMKKKDEYRIHVFKGKIIDMQRKAMRAGVPPVQHRIRNHDNGYVFIRQDVDPPLKVKNAACDAVSALRLDFGAVDVIWNQKFQTAAVLEVNTAPGLSETTAENYACAIVQLNENRFRA